MKKIILLLVVCGGSPFLWGQTTAALNLNSGVHLKSQGGAYLVLNNTHLINEDGVIQQEAGEGVVKFTGGASVLITGEVPILIDRLELAKQPATVLRLGGNIRVGTSLTFSGGLLNLDNFMVDLGSGVLLGESEQSRIYTTGSGFIQVIGLLNAPVQVNMGNLGAVVSSGVNLGNTIIRRGHAVQTGIAGMNQSIKRYFDIIPSPKSTPIKLTNAVGLKISLRFRYFDAELNGLNESNLQQWRTKDSLNWELAGANSTDALANYVQLNNISKLYRTTLAEATAPIISCPENLTVSSNISACRAVINLTGSNGATAAGIPVPELTYYINGSPITTSYIFPKGTTTVMAMASNGVTPTASCTFTVTVVCGPVTMAAAQAPISEQLNPVGKLSITVLPNPSDNYFTLRASSPSAQPFNIRVFDALGRFVEQRSNLTVNLMVSIGQQYRPGVYVVEVVQGKEKVVVRLIKR